MVHRRLTRAVMGMAVLAAASSCRREPAEPANEAVANAPASKSETPIIPLPKPGLDREQVIVGAMRALTATALGQDDVEAQRALKGREFELRLRFGCPGVTAIPSRSWSYDSKEHVLRVNVSADLASEAVPSSDLLLSGYEGVVGFTIAKPLLLTAGCPAPPFVGMGANEPTIAVAQLFTSQDSRVQRPQKTYKLTKSVDEADKPTEGLDLVISGRLAELRDGRAIHCAAGNGPPACIVAADFDRVAIENPANGEVLGEWSNW